MTFEQCFTAALRGELTPEWGGHVPRASGVSLSPSQLTIQLVDAKRTHDAALAKQLLESHPADARELRRFARRKRPPRVERDCHFLAQFGFHLFARNAHRIRRGIGNIERQLHGCNVGDRSAESKASMGLRSGDRGDLRLITEVKKEDNTSMGPRSWDRGEAPGEFFQLARFLRFNGAAVL